MQLVLEYWVGQNTHEKVLTAENFQFKFKRKTCNETKYAQTFFVPNSVNRYFQSEIL